MAPKVKDLKVVMVISTSGLPVAVVVPQSKEAPLQQRQERVEKVQL
jgi:predicted regulator of Ras-like GTPase activity (Roadblock/LC7/MglB family)